MQVLTRPRGTMQYRMDEPPGGAPAVFADAPGAGLRSRDAALPPGIRAIRFDRPGHGLSGAGGARAAAGLTADTARLAPPALVLAGAHDGAQPLARLIPDAVFPVVPGAGRPPRVETPADRSAPVRPFLQDHAR